MPLHGDLQQHDYGSARIGVLRCGSSFYLREQALHLKGQKD